MKLNDKDFYTLFGAALESDYDTYIAEWSTSDIFFPDPDAEGPSFDDIVDTLGKVWNMAHISIKDIRARTGLSQAAFAQRFCIPRRTIEDWEAGRRTPPDYVRLLLAESPRIANI